MSWYLYVALVAVLCGVAWLVVGWPTRHDAGWIAQRRRVADAVAAGRMSPDAALALLYPPRGKRGRRVMNQAELLDMVERYGTACHNAAVTLCREQPVPHMRHQARAETLLEDIRTALTTPPTPMPDVPPGVDPGDYMRLELQADEVIHRPSCALNTTHHLTCTCGATTTATQRYITAGDGVTYGPFDAPDTRTVVVTRDDLVHRFMPTEGAPDSCAYVYEGEGPCDRGPAEHPR